MDVRVGLWRKLSAKELMFLNCGSWRRCLRVPWTAGRSNQSILKDISPECSLEGMMLKLRLQYFGHLMWRTDSFEKTLLLGKILEKVRQFRKSIYFCFIDYSKAFNCVDHNWKILKRCEYQATLFASWETCRQAKKQQLKPDIEKWTGSKLEKEYVKAVYCHLAYLTLFQQDKRRLYTWTAPYGQHQNQIYYILCSQRWRISVQSAKTRPRADWPWTPYC